MAKLSRAEERELLKAFAKKYNSGTMTYSELDVFSAAVLKSKIALGQYGEALSNLPEIPEEENPVWNWLS